MIKGKESVMCGTLRANLMCKGTVILALTIVAITLTLTDSAAALNCEVKEVEHHKESRGWVTGVLAMCGLWQAVYITPWPLHDAYPGAKVSVDVTEDGGMRLSKEQPPPNERKRTEYECKQRGLYCRTPVN